MKKLFTVLLLTVSIFSYSQTDSTEVQMLDSINITEAERIVDKYSGKVVETFKEFTQAITPSIKEGFGMVVKLQIAKGIGLLLPILLAIIFWFLNLKETNRIRSNKDNEHYGVYSEDNASIWLVMSLLLSLTFTLMAIFSTFAGILHIAAPEWYAVKEIINLIK